MKSTPKGIENLTEDARRITRIDEGRPISGFSYYLLSPTGWVWSCRYGKFLRPRYGNRADKNFRYCLTKTDKFSFSTKKTECFNARELVKSIFKTNP